MARAKRTSRADARRRYRAQLAAETNVEPADAPESREPTTPASRGAPRPATQPQPTGMRYAFRAAFHPVNFRDDVAHLRQVLLSRAVVVPTAVSIGTAVALAATGGTDIVSRLLAQYFLVPPPIGSIFIAGFFAPRASYIAGFVVGLVAAIALSVLVAAAPALTPSGVGGVGASPSPGASAVASSPGASGSPAASAASPPANPSGAASASTAPSGSLGASPSPGASASGEVPPTDPLQVAGFALLASPLAGIVFASAAAWYRRFLQLSNPNRARAAAVRARPRERRR